MYSPIVAWPTLMAHRSKRWKSLQRKKLADLKKNSAKLEHNFIHLLTWSCYKELVQEKVYHIF